MIYLDTSVALARVFNEPARPTDAFWASTLVASRLVQYEIWNRLHARSATKHSHERARLVIARLRFVEMAPRVLERALQSFPVPVRTLDSLHLATMDHLREREGVDFLLASYDRRLVQAAEALGFRMATI